MGGAGAPPAAAARRADATFLAPWRLPPRAHAVYELAPGLLLVFKPRGHRETAHAHAYAQRLRVLRGRLEVTTARGVVLVEAGGRPLRIAARRVHATRARCDTWLIVDRP